MLEPTVSIVLPAYNADRFLPEAIDSVLTQSFEDWELLIIDDGSTDASPELIHEASRSPRVRTFQQPNNGVSAARNVGLSNMRGRYFTFLDADDLLPSTSLQSRVEYLDAHPEVDILAGGVSSFAASPDLPVKVWRPSYAGNPLRWFCRLSEKVFYNPSYMIRRYANIAYRFQPELTHAEDLLFFINICAQKPSLYAGLPEEIVYHYRRHSESAMANLRGLEKGYRGLYNAISALKNDEVRASDLLYLRYRYVRIMVLSYLRRGDYLDAARVLLDLSGLRL